jgi:antitoxin MazE
MGEGVKTLNKKDIELEDLLKDCNDDNRHEEVDWGKPEGKEIW